MFFAANVPAGRKTAVIEKNSILGKKLLITGKGRCNLTNNTDVPNLIKNVRTNSNFLYGAFNSFSAYDTMDFFESLGVPLKTERGNRVFPQSDRSSDIVSALRRKISENGVSVIKDKILKIKKDGNIFILISENTKYYSENVVVATGGKSYPKTGSDGDGYKFAESFGHTVTEIRPSLVPLELYESDLCGSLQGLSLKNIAIKIRRGDVVIYKDFGEMIFTHFGVSGPVILSASAFTENGDILTVDLKPALDEKQLDKRLLGDFNKYGNKNFSNALGDLLPAKLINVFISLSGISPYKKVHDITHEERKKILYLLKNLSFTVKQCRSIDEAIITCGGVSVKEINPKTVESKIERGLYFIGEVIDTDAYTGGFNLQIAFSTAMLAVNNIYN